MRGPALSAILAVSVASSGCLSGVWGDLTGSDLVFEQVLSFSQSFSYSGALDPTAPPSGPDDAYDTMTASFLLPEGSEMLAVTYEVGFRALSEELDLPEETREVRVSLLGPGGAELQAATHASDGGNTWSFDEPNHGSWSLEVRARGEGHIIAFASAFVPEDT